MEEVFNREGVEAFLSKLEGALLASPQPLASAIHEGAART